MQAIGLNKTQFSFANLHCWSDSWEWKIYKNVVLNDKNGSKNNEFLDIAGIQHHKPSTSGPGAPPGVQKTAPKGPGRPRRPSRMVPGTPPGRPRPSREAPGPVPGAPGRSWSTPNRPPDGPNPSRANPKAPQSLPRTEFCVLSGRPLHEKLQKLHLQSSSSVRTFPSTAACAQHIESAVRLPHMACWTTLAYKHACIACRT